MGKLAPIVEIDLDKPRHLKFDLNAMIEYERATGQSMAGAEMGSTLASLRALLWAALVHENREWVEDSCDTGHWRYLLTVEQVGEMIHSGNIADVNAALSRLFADTFQSDADAPKAVEAAPSHLTGRRSGR